MEGAGNVGRSRALAGRPAVESSGRSVEMRGRIPRERELVRAPHQLSTGYPPSYAQAESRSSECFSPANKHKHGAEG